MEVVLAGIAARRMVFLAAMSAILASILLLWVACFVGSVIAGLPAGGSAYLALSVLSTAVVFVGVGALASQLAPTRRLALELGGAAVALAFALRVIADTSSSAGWLRWLTPLGWTEELRPFIGAQPAVLLAPLVASGLLLWLSVRIAARRDIGSGVLAARDEADPRRGLLSSSTAHAFRAEVTSLLVWAGSVGAFAFILGVISKSISPADISKQLQRELEKLGTGNILTPTGYLGFAFIFFVLAISLFACAQTAAARREEAEQWLETELALPVSRREWLGGRLALAAVSAAVLSLIAGALTWAGAASAGVHVSLARLLEAGANCLPVALLFLGVAALAYSTVPRASAGIAYGLATVAFLWQLFGSLLGAPKWPVDATPFAHVGLVPAQPFRAGAAAVMVGIGLLCALAAIWRFERRDLMGA